MRNWKLENSSKIFLKKNEIAFEAYTHLMFIQGNHTFNIPLRNIYEATYPEKTKRDNNSNKNWRRYSIGQSIL